MKKKYAIIYWRDIHTVTDDKQMWQDKEEAKKKGKYYFNLALTTGGEIIENNKDYILIAGTTCNDSEREIIYSDISMIPKSVILKIKYL